MLRPAGKVHKSKLKPAHLKSIAADHVRQAVAAPVGNSGDREICPDSLEKTMSAERNKERRAEQRKLTRTRFMVRWQQVRPAGTALFAEICDTRETAQDFIVGWLWGGTKADGPVYVDRQQRDAAGKWQTLVTEEVSRKT